MSISTQPTEGRWSSRWLFVLAAAGSAVGLGNIWKFPYIAGENGGGAFVLIYLVCVAFVGAPIMISEVMLGRKGRASPINTMRKLAQAGRGERALDISGVDGCFSWHIDSVVLRGYCRLGVELYLANGLRHL